MESADCPAGDDFASMDTLSAEAEVVGAAVDIEPVPPEESGTEVEAKGTHGSLLAMD